jgi:ABC-type transport system involved in multi-copper enzyme maturation permease subunit
MKWQLWVRQIEAVARMELKRFLLARRWVGVYFVALGPVVLAFIRSQFAPPRLQQLPDLTQSYALLFQLFELRFAIFISAAVVFTQAFRGDILEKTLHFYLLTPARREVIVLGKYVAGVTFIGLLHTSSTFATHLLIYSANSEFGSFFFEGPGVSHLVRYVAVAALASIAYGGIFMLTGLLFKNTGVPAVGLLAWESLNFAFPPLLQMFSVIHYLQALLPVTIDRGPFAIVTEPPSPLLGIPILLIATFGFLAASGGLVRNLQVTYSAD